MRMRSGRLAAAVFGIVLVAGGRPLAAQDRTVILVRHAEKAAPDGDPRLSAAGQARATALAAALAGARVSAIITTQYQRTQATAAPTAASAGVTPEIVPTGTAVPAHAAAVAAAVWRYPPGAVILVVGHSNTIPPIIAALGGPRLPDLCDPEYATLFILTLPRAGPARLIRASYGAADTVAAGCRAPVMH